MADFQSELVARGMPLNASQLSFAFVRFDMIPTSFTARGLQHPLCPLPWASFVR